MVKVRYLYLLLFNPLIYAYNVGVNKGGWLPVGSVSTMSDEEPNLIRIVNKDWVVWKGDEWSVQEDVCIHRKAPLSQGRIDNKCVELISSAVFQLLFKMGRTRLCYIT